MEIFKEFEKQVINLLVSGIFSSEKLDEIIKNAEFRNYEYIGSGYFLEIRHPDLPQERIVYSKPTIVGEADGIVCSFVIFMENHKLILECHSWSEINVTSEFRNKAVKIKQSEL